MDQTSPDKKEIMHREKRFINIVLTICLILGFICVAIIYIPDRLSSEETNISKEKAIPGNLSSLVPQNDLPPAEEETGNPALNKNEIYSRFTPEPEPTPPKIAKPKQSSEPVGNLSIAEIIETKQHSTSSLSTNKKTNSENNLFRIPISLEPDVTFWKYIYAKYDSSQVVFHDLKYLDIIYSALDLKNIQNNPLLTDAQKEKKRAKVIEDEKNRILNILEKLSTNPAEGELSKQELQVSYLFSKQNNPDKFKDAIARGVRAQQGLKDKFLEGLIRSGKYLGEMENIFNNLKLPSELTRLVFVESMFNIDAHSFAGAKGLWQFMEGTGKLYNLKINSNIDERADPIKATYAAAALLKDNFDTLESWPLAINAYNAGRGRLKQAKERLGTNDIATIVKTFGHPAYGFASRNFYMEFLAAFDVVKNYSQYFGEVKFDDPISYNIIKTKKPIILPQIANKSNITIDEIRELNPALKKSILEGKNRLPAGSEIRLPKDKGKEFTDIANQTAPTYPIIHIVEQGETLREISEMYAVPSSQILKTNKFLYKKRLKAGQEIRIVE